MQGLDKTLSLGAKNSTVAAFKDLVEFSTADTAKRLAQDIIGLDTDNIGQGAINKFRSPVRYEFIEELDKSLYDKALNLPEANSVNLKRISSTSKHQYGRFIGGNVYKSFNGDLDTTVKDVRGQEGWVTFDNSNSDYCLFSNDEYTVIIAISDFEPIPIVEDFMPLYEKLKSRVRYSDNEFLNDIHLSLSLAASYGYAVSDFLLEKKYKLWLIYMNAYRTVGEFQLLIHELSLDNKNLALPSNLNSLGSDKSKYDENNTLIETLAVNTSYNPTDTTDIEEDDTLYTIKRYTLEEENPEKKSAESRGKTYFGFYPKQIATSKNINGIKNSSAYNDIQAVIYDISGSVDEGLSKSNNMLICYQQPERVSYTASAQYDSVSPRGSQVPFQFYQCANAMTMSFDLKFHIDEVRTFTDDGSPYTLQKIAEIADGFTRPWKQVESIRPKLCHVILPGISKIGYITQAQIGFLGDMTGDFSRGSGVLEEKRVTVDGKEEKTLVGSDSVTEYHYTQLEISFELLIVQDVSLERSPNKIKVDTGTFRSNLYRRFKKYAENLPVQQETQQETQQEIQQESVGTDAGQKEELKKFESIDAPISAISNGSKFLSTVNNCAKIAKVTVGLMEAISNMNKAAQNLILGT